MKQDADEFIPIEGILDLVTSEEVTIQHKAGQIMLIQIWASYNKASQKEMSLIQKILETNSAKWGDKIRILTISIDSTAEIALNHVNSKGWTAAEHYQVGKSTCTRDYGVRGIPHVLIIDIHGHIAYEGSSEDVTIDNYLNMLFQAQLDEDCFIERDINKISDEMDAYEKTTSELVENIKSKCDVNSLAKDLIVFMRLTKYDPETEKSVTDFQNVN